MLPLDRPTARSTSGRGRVGSGHQVRNARHQADVVLEFVRAAAVTEGDLLDSVCRVAIRPSSAARLRETPLTGRRSYS
jgi:hypothetical protein